MAALIGANSTNSSSLEETRFSIEWIVIFGTIYTSFTIVGTVGNVLVIAAVSTDRKMRASNMNVLLMNLAMADLGNLLSCTTEWGQVLWNQGPGWTLPLPILCPSLRFCEVTFLYTSLLTQIIISIERFIAIVHPMHARHMCTRQKIMWCAAGSWLFAALFASPYALFHKRQDNGCIMVLPKLHPNFWLAYKWTECLLFYFIPLVIMVAVYTKVILVLSRKDKMLQANTIVDHQSSAQQRRAAIRVRLGVVRMLVACVCVYFVFYSPIQTMFLSTAVLGYDLRPRVYIVGFFLNALAIACSAANPLLYSLFSQRFRVKFTQMLCCLADNGSATAAASSVAAPLTNRGGLPAGGGRAKSTTAYGAKASPVRHKVIVKLEGEEGRSSVVWCDDQQSNCSSQHSSEPPAAADKCDRFRTSISANCTDADASVELLHNSETQLYRKRSRPNKHK